MIAFHNSSFILHPSFFFFLFFHFGQTGVFGHLSTLDKTQETYLYTSDFRFGQVRCASVHITSSPPGRGLRWGSINLPEQTSRLFFGHYNIYHICVIHSRLRTIMGNSGVFSGRFGCILRTFCQVVALFRLLSVHMCRSFSDRALANQNQQKHPQNCKSDAIKIEEGCLSVFQCSGRPGGIL